MASREPAPLARIPDGVTLEMILVDLVERHGWAALAAEVPIRCFQHEPSVASSLVFLRRTPWARARVETMYRRGLDATPPTNPLSNIGDPVYRVRALDPANTGSMSVMPGNRLFEAAVVAIGFDRDVIRLMLSLISNTIGVHPDAMTPDELGILLPELERRLRKLVPDDHVGVAMKRIQQMLLGWDERE